MLTSRQNPRIRALVELRDRKDRKAPLVLAEGIHLAAEALCSAVDLRTLILSARALDRPQTQPLRQRAEKAGVEILEVADACYERFTDLQSPEGVAIVFAPRQTLEADLFHPQARLLVAAGVQDPGNAGALVRVAEAAGADGFLSLGGVDPLSPRFLRAAMGSAFRLPCLSLELEEALPALTRAGIRLLAATGGEAEAHERIDYAPPVAICVGSEGAGLPASLISASSSRIRIPMAGRVESLNVAVAAGILLYEARKAWALR